MKKTVDIVSGLLVVGYCALVPRAYNMCGRQSTPAGARRSRGEIFLSVGMTVRDYPDKNLNFRVRYRTFPHQLKLIKQ